MLRSTAIFSILLVSSNAYFLLPYPLSDDVISFMADLEKPGDLESTHCPIVQLNYCQYKFNAFFGLTDSTSFKNGAVIFDTVQQYLDMNVTELINVCSTRSQFQQCLGSAYHGCMNLHTLLLQNGVTQQNAFDYVRTFRGLEWMCNGGFKESIGQFDCLKTLPTTNAYQHCVTTFNSTVSTANLCRTVQKTENCINSIYHDQCGAKAGHYGCESFRNTFDKACNGNLHCAM